MHLTKPITQIQPYQENPCFIYPSFFPSFISLSFSLLLLKYSIESQALCPSSPIPLYPSFFKKLIFLIEFQCHSYTSKFRNDFLVSSLSPYSYSLDCLKNSFFNVDLFELGTRLGPHIASICYFS